MKKVFIIAIYVITILLLGCKSRVKKYDDNYASIDSCHVGSRITRQYDLPFISVNRNKKMSESYVLKPSTYLRIKNQHYMCVRTMLTSDTIERRINTNFNQTYYTYFDRRGMSQYFCSREYVVMAEKLDSLNNIVEFEVPEDSLFLRFLVNRKFDGVNILYSDYSGNWVVHHVYINRRGFYGNRKNRFGGRKIELYQRIRLFFRFPIRLQRVGQ